MPHDCSSLFVSADHFIPLLIVPFLSPATVPFSICRNCLALSRPLTSFRSPFTWEGRPLHAFPPPLRHLVKQMKYKITVPYALRQVKSEKSLALGIQAIPLTPPSHPFFVHDRLLL